MMSKTQYMDWNNWSKIKLKYILIIKDYVQIIYNITTQEKANQKKFIYLDGKSL